jgi:putative transcriptional regulator
MISPAPGILLIAEPFLKDPHFMRTVVLICKHEEEEGGSFGFVLNKIFSLQLDAIIPELAGFDLPVYEGGPVQLDTLHYIHQYPDLLPDSVKVTDDVYWGGDFDTLKTLLTEGLIDTGKIRFFLGYSGWDNMQLEREMEEKTWITVEANKTLIFDTAPGDLWRASLLQLGGKYEIMIHFPTDPQLN